MCSHGWGQKPRSYHSLPKIYYINRSYTVLKKILYNNLKVNGTFGPLTIMLLQFGP